MEDYLGIFSQAKEKYVIMSGEKKLLKKVSEICTSLYRDHGDIPRSEETDVLQCENIGSSPSPNQHPRSVLPANTASLFDALKKWLAAKPSLCVVSHLIISFRVVK